MHKREMSLELASLAGGAAARTRQRLEAVSSASAARKAWPQARPDSPIQAVRDAIGERLTYWSYIDLDTLLLLGKPRSTVADERVFIVFHQIAELLFSLIILELEQIIAAGAGRTAIWNAKLQRVILHFQLVARVTGSMAKVIEREHFLAFRAALAPASAFQSFQYRKIELLCGCLFDLMPPEHRARLAGESRAELLFEHLYWRKALGAGRPAHERTTLTDFERQYLGELWRIAADQRGRTLAELFRAMPARERGDPMLTRWLRQLDRLANEVWPQVHYQLAKAFLPADGQGTGGTDWRKYLSTSRSGIRFFPELCVGPTAVSDRFST